MEGGKLVESRIREQRQATLDEISSFVTSCSDTLQTILKEVGWTDDNLQDGAKMITCPVNANHSIQESSLQTHRERCEWARDGYTREEQEESFAAEGNQFFYQNSQGVSSVTLDPEQQHGLLMRISGKAGGSLPRTMDRLEADFSPEQRLAIYEWVLEHFRDKRQREEGQLELDLDFPLDLDNADAKKDDQGAGKAKSHMEVLAEMRDYRRRRQSYRAKNVHITKKSKTDVMREIIDAHMKFLEETAGTSPEKQRDSTDLNQDRGSNRSRSRDRKGRRRSRSRDRSTSADNRSRSGSRSRDSTPHGHHHRSKTHKHKHKHKHKSHKD